eukprot:923497-Prymnesium_polylepis.1
MSPHGGRSTVLWFDPCRPYERPPPQPPSAARPPPPPPPPRAPRPPAPRPPLSLGELPRKPQGRCSRAGQAQVQPQHRPQPRRTMARAAVATEAETA